MYDFSSLKNKKEEVKDWLVKEYTGLRTGRSTPAILDNITVEAYGIRTPLNQMANITVEGPRSLKVTPWDISQVKAIEKSIRDSDLGLSVATDASSLRLTFPELTTERREQLKKIVHQKREQARISLRTEREKVWEDIQKQEKAGEMAEDDKFRYKDEMQKIIDQAGQEIDDLTARKEKELTEN